MNVEFDTNTRIHVAIPVQDIEASVAFYEQLFEQPPTKLRADYAKFEVADPPVNYTLNRTADVVAPSSPQHYGIQVKTPSEVADFRARVEAAGLTTHTEDGVTCCYAVMDKVWLGDPDGHAWEIFAVTDPDAATHSVPPASIPAQAAESSEEAGDDAPCCAPTCCK